MPLPASGFPCCSKLIEKKWEERKMKLHAQKVHAVETTLKTGPPRVYPHMILRLKQIQKEEEKLADIDRANQILLQRMTWILKRKGQVDNWNDYRQMSMNHSVRERELQAISDKNLHIARKLHSVKPYYSAYEQEEDYDKKQHLQSMWNRSTRDFELQSTTTTPRGSMASKRGTSSEDKKDGSRGDQKNKSDSNPSSVTKLPKINSNANTKYPREYVRRRRRHRRRRMSSRLSESEEESTSSHSSSSREVNNHDSDYDSKKKDKKETRANKQSRDSERKHRRKRDEQKKNESNSEKPKKTQKKVRIRTNSTSSVEDDEDRVYDLERVHSVVRDKRTKQGQRSVSRGFSGKLETEDDTDDKTTDDNGEDSDDIVFSSPEDVDDDDNDGSASDDKDSPADHDAKLLFRAVKNLVKPEEAVGKALIRRTATQRLQTKDRYEDTYDTNLAAELKKTLGSPHNVLIDCLLGTGGKNNTIEIHTALKAQDMVKLVNLFMNKGSSQMSTAVTNYKKDFDVSLEEDIEAKTEDEDCQALLLALIHDRPDGQNVDEDLATREAEELREAGEGRFSNENGKFIRLLKERSKAQLDATFSAYNVISGGKGLKEILEEDQCSEEFTAAVEELEKLGGQDQSYWAVKIHSQLKPNNPDFINLLLEKSEQDMKGILKAYRKKYRSELSDDIASKCGREAGPLIAQIVTKGGGPSQRQTSKQQNEERRVNGVLVPVRQKNPPLRGFSRKTPDFGKDNPFQEPMKRPIGEHIRKEARDKLGNKKQPVPPKGSKTDRDEKKRPLAKGHGEGKGSKSTNADDDAKKIHEVLKGGTDEEALINILTSRNNEHRQQIRKTYQESYDSDLLEDLKSGLSGDFEEAVLALMMGAAEYDAHCLHDAMDGLGTNEAVLIGILTTRNAKEIKAISAQYKKAYGETIESAIGGDTSGGFKNLLLDLVKGGRDQKTSVDQKLVDQDAKALYQDGEELNIKDEAFKTVMTKRSRAHTKSVFDKYKKLSGHTIESAIKDALSGDAEEGYLGLAQALSDTSEFYARRLHDAMTGPGTNDTTLIRIMVSRSEVDLLDIKDKYKSLYGKTLDEAVDSECSGDYKKLLLSILKDNIIKQAKDARSTPRNHSREKRDNPKTFNSSTGYPYTRKGDPNQNSTDRRIAATEPYPVPPKGEKPSNSRRQKVDHLSKPNQNLPHKPPGSPRSKRARKVSKDQNEESSKQSGTDNKKEQSNPKGKLRSDAKSNNENTQEKETDSVGKEEDRESIRKLVERPPTPTQGTIRMKENKPLEEDLEALEAALKGWNNDEAALINLLCRRTYNRRQEIRSMYEEKYGKDLLQVLKSELSGDFERAMIMMMNSTEELIAEQLNDCIDSMSEDNPLLSNMLAHNNQEEIKEITSKYKTLFKKSFIKDVKENGTDYAFVEIMTEILSGSRDMTYMVDEEGAKENAKTMYNNGKHRVKPVDETFRYLLTKANRQQFKLTSQEYKKLAGEDLVESIRWAMIGDSEDAIIGLVQCIEDPVAYFAEHLNEAMEGVGTNDVKLISIIVSRSEIDLANIKTKFKVLFLKELEKAIDRECSGDYKKMLIAILNGQPVKTITNTAEGQQDQQDVSITQEINGETQIFEERKDTSKGSVKNEPKHLVLPVVTGAHVDPPETASEGKEIEKKSPKMVTRSGGSNGPDQKKIKKEKDTLKKDYSLQKKKEEIYKNNTGKHTIISKTHYTEGNEGHNLAMRRNQKSTQQQDNSSNAAKLKEGVEPSKEKSVKKRNVTQKHEQGKLIWANAEDETSGKKGAEQGKYRKVEVIEVRKDERSVPQKSANHHQHGRVEDQQNVTLDITDKQEKTKNTGIVGQSIEGADIIAVAALAVGVNSDEISDLDGQVCGSKCENMTEQKADNASTTQQESLKNASAPDRENGSKNKRERNKSLTDEETQKIREKKALMSTKTSDLPQMSVSSANSESSRDVVAKISNVQDKDFNDVQEENLHPETSGQKTQKKDHLEHELLAIDSPAKDVGSLLDAGITSKGVKKDQTIHNKEDKDLVKIDKGTMDPNKAIEGIIRSRSDDLLSSDHTQEIEKGIKQSSSKVTPSNERDKLSTDDTAGDAQSNTGTFLKAVGEVEQGDKEYDKNDNNARDQGNDIVEKSLEPVINEDCGTLQTEERNTSKKNTEELDTNARAVSQTVNSGKNQSGSKYGEKENQSEKSNQETDTVEDTRSVSSATESNKNTNNDIESHETNEFENSRAISKLTKLNDTNDQTIPCSDEKSLKARYEIMGESSGNADRKSHSDRLQNRTTGSKQKGNGSIEDIELEPEAYSFGKSFRGVFIGHRLVNTDNQNEDSNAKSIDLAGEEEIIGKESIPDEGSAIDFGNDMMNLILNGSIVDTKQTPTNSRNSSLTQNESPTKVHPVEESTKGYQTDADNDLKSKSFDNGSDLEELAPYGEVTNQTDDDKSAINFGNDMMNLIFNGSIDSLKQSLTEGDPASTAQCDSPTSKEADPGTENSDGDIRAGKKIPGSVSQFGSLPVGSSGAVDRQNKDANDEVATTVLRDEKDSTIINETQDDINARDLEDKIANIALSKSINEEKTQDMKDGLRKSDFDSNDDSETSGRAENQRYKDIMENSEDNKTIDATAKDHDGQIQGNVRSNIQSDNNGTAFGKHKKNSVSKDDNAGNNISAQEETGLDLSKEREKHENNVCVEQSQSNLESNANAVEVAQSLLSNSMASNTTESSTNPLNEDLMEENEAMFSTEKDTQCLDNISNIQNQNEGHHGKSDNAKKLQSSNNENEHSARKQNEMQHETKQVKNQNDDLDGGSSEEVKNLEEPSGRKLERQTKIGEELMGTVVNQECEKATEETQKDESGFEATSHDNSKEENMLQGNEIDKEKKNKIHMEKKDPEGKETDGLVESDDTDIITTSILEYDLLDPILETAKQSSNESKKVSDSYSSDGKDEGIDTAEGSESKESSPKEADEAKDPVQSKTSEPITPNTEFAKDTGASTNEGSLHKSAQLNPKSELGEEELDIPRPRDPMCSAKQAKVERTPVRKDTVYENMGAEVLVEKQAEELRRKRARLMRRKSTLRKKLAKRRSGFFEANSNREFSRNNSFDSEFDPNDPDLDAASREVLVGTCGEWSTDDDMEDGDIFDDDWEEELAAVTERDGETTDEPDCAEITMSLSLKTKGEVIKEEETGLIGTVEAGKANVASSLNVEEISQGGDSGLGITELILKGTEDETTGKIINRGFVKEIVSNIIKKSMNELESSQTRLTINN